MHITMTGNLGSGKSTVCKILSEQYHFEIYSTGKVQRELASQLNMTTLELNQMMRSDKKYDKMIDDETARISRDNKDKDIIFDSRLAWHFVEKSFKVFVSVSLEVAANRVMNDQRGAVESYSSLEEAKELLAKRADTECIRYKEIYDLNYMDFTNFDLVIDSTYATPNEIAELIMKEARAYEEKPFEKTKILVSPKRLKIDQLQDQINEDVVNQIKEDLNTVSIIPSTVIPSKKLGDDYMVLGEFPTALAAIRSGINFVSIEEKSV